MFNYSKIPEHCREGMKRYIEQGIAPGSFLTAVLSNDLVGAFIKADDINALRMRDYCDFLYNEIPMPAWGSRLNVKTWINSFRKGSEGE